MSANAESTERLQVVPDEAAAVDAAAPAGDDAAPAADAPVVPLQDDATFRAELLAAIPAVRAFARGLCGYREMADDLAQETLVKAWAARARYRPEGNFKAWLFKILRNHYYEQGRRAGRFAEWDQTVADRILTVPAAQHGAIDLADVRRGLNKLGPEQREAVLLVGPGGFSYEEVAEITGCAIGTVKSRVARARAALQRYVDGPALPAEPGPTDPDDPGVAAAA